MSLCLRWNHIAARSNQNVGLLAARWFSFSFPFWLLKERSKRWYFRPVFDSWLISSPQSFHSGNLFHFGPPLCCASIHEKSFQQEMKDGAINNVVVALAKRTYCARTHQSRALVWPRQLSRFSWFHRSFFSHSLSFSLSYSDVIKSDFIFTWKVFFQNSIGKVWNPLFQLFSSGRF